MLYTKEELEEAIQYKIEESQKRFGKEFKFALMDIYALLQQMNPAQPQEKRTMLIELSKWNEHHPYPTVGALRQYVNRRYQNGFDKVIEYGGENGGRILIKEDAFFEWQASRKKANP